MSGVGARSLGATRVWLGSLMLWGCIGNIGDRPSGASSDPGSLPEAGALGSAPLRRLTAREHASAIRDLLGLDVSDVIASFPDDGSVDGFDNNALVQSATPQHVRRWQVAAEAAAELLLASPEQRAALVDCEPVGAGRDACLRSIIERFGRMAFRRALDDSEVEGLRAVADVAADDPDPLASVAMVVRAVLQAPQFVFKIERGRPVVGRTDVLGLTGPELATRLSFALWGTTPDAALLDAAEAGELDDVAGVEAHARALATDERARGLARTFAAQWLRVSAMATVELDTQLFPELDEELRAAATQEVALLAGDFLWGEASLLGLYDAPFTYADPALAALYGVPAPATENHQPIAVPERGGLFGTAGFLMVTSHPNNTSVVRRGKYVREVALCDPPPPPPENVSAAPPDPGQSAQEASAQHSSDPACSGCHLRLDPIGFGLERFDALGRLRESYQDGSPLPTEGFVQGLEPGTFAGAVELGQLVARSEQSPRCVVIQSLRFALGRSLEQRDRASVEELSTRFVEAGEQFQELLVAIATSDAFRYLPAPTPAP